jgi:ketosteroid isomerase-like protein
MGDHENERVVQEMYAAFGRGDIPGVLDTLSDEH